MSRWFARVTVSVAVAVILLALIPLDAVWAALRQVRPWVWAASLGVFFAGHYLNALKLRLLIGPSSASVAACVQAQFAGLAANLGLPGLAGGDVVRAAYLAPTAGTRRVVVAGVADRLLDTLVLVIVVAVALPVAGVPPAIGDVVWRGGWWLVGMALAVLVTAAVAVTVLRRIGLARHVDQIRSELKSRSSAMAGVVAITLLVQPAFVLTNVWLAREVGVAVSTAAWFVAWPVSKLIAVLPVSLGGIGVREAALVSLLAPYGVALDSVLAAGILWEGVLVVGALAGLVVTQVVKRQSIPLATSSEERM